MTRRKGRVRLAAAVVCVAALTGCTVTLSGSPTADGQRTGASGPPGTAAGAPTSSSAPSTPTKSGPGAVFPTLSTAPGIPDGSVGPKPDAPEPAVTVIGGTGDQSDVIAANALADLFDYYGSIFPDDFHRPFTPPGRLVSYDSTDPTGAVCGQPTFEVVNAFYMRSCDTVAWDRGIMLPELIKDIGTLAPAVVLSHEAGHSVQGELSVPDDTPTIVLEQQADCYAGAYWRWVADGNSAYFAFNQTEGMRQMLLSLFQAHDPAGSSGSGEDDHGNGFDRTYAATLGYTSGAVRCSRIDAAEIALRGQEFPFDEVPRQYGNVDISDDVLSGIADTVDEYFSQTAPGYVPPALVSHVAGELPPCPEYATTRPVSYCPTTNTIAYELDELARIGTPTAGWESVNGDFSAIIILVSRYALAAQAAGGSTIIGDDAGLRALCYAGSWAAWMRNSHNGFQLSPNDLDKAIYQIVSSPVAGSDVNGETGASLIERVQAFDIGVTHPIPECFDFYAG